MHRTKLATSFHLHITIDIKQSIWFITSIQGRPWSRSHPRVGLSEDITWSWRVNVNAKLVEHCNSQQANYPIMWFTVNGFYRDKNILPMRWVLSCGLAYRCDETRQGRNKTCSSWDGYWVVAWFTDVHVHTPCGQNINTCQISVMSDWATITESMLLSDCINCYGCFGA